MTASPPVTRDTLDRRLAWLIVVLAAGCLVGLAGVLVPWGDEFPGAGPAPVDSAFTAGEVARAERYASAVRVLSLSATALSLAVALLFALTPAGSRLARLLGRRLPWWAAVPATALILVLAGRLVTLPLAYLIHRENLEVGLTSQALGGWLTDRALSTLVSWGLAALVVLLVVASARRSPRRWFVAAGLASAAATLALSMLYPVVIEPLFNNFRPMPAGSLKASLLALARKEGVKVDDVLVADASRRTTTLNAYVSGLGGTRRIVVYDNLLADLPAPEVRAVVAHEIAHARNHDVLVGTGLGAVGALLGMGVLALLLDRPTLQRRSGVGGAGDPAVVALVLGLVAVGTLLAAPVENTVSRAIEARADRVALEVTRDPAAFRQLQRQLALRSLADPTPPAWSQFWFGSHPTVVERLGAADAYARAASLRRRERPG